MDGMEVGPTQAEFLAKAGLKNCNFVNIATTKYCKKFKTVRRTMVMEHFRNAARKFWICRKSHEIQAFS